MAAVPELPDLVVAKREIRMPDGRRLIYFTFRPGPRDAAPAPRKGPDDAGGRTERRDV